ncbi:uncharacterized protein MONBRDRAFT_38546 [Monosiga brevicollis MX1]|uniref:Brix domain-containing protein n=1 Tax=Monosiga brevicollis TaxID=81824 RepID=A9V8M8_MONBE|nr:uncharacterized protein MONBRDRAFT_38546 [Monosiga brevicollis MX1]EDQ86111.1 predicted protein [Monosiga brevicollis MX1]|eukprot:XP_001749036.1 hypothetical protein [Monosiga brevicollis MX1]
MREKDDTIVDPEDDEVMQDQATDELASYFDGKEPKVLITTSNKACGDAYQFGEILANMIPSAQFFKRKGFELKTIIKQAIAKGFTDVMVINEDKKKVNGLVVSHLPDGPTAHFKVTNIKYAKEIHNHGASTMHYPEVIINNFHTRLGHQVGRQLTALFPQVPEFEGRAVVTFHNQRDFIFVRRHRYIFRNKERVGLQELGPRFTLKLRSLQKGTFDTKFGEYEFVYRSELGTGRRKFFL